MAQQPIYLDYAAATPLEKRVFAAMQPYLGEQFYNPSAAYLAAGQVAHDVRRARERVAALIGAKPTEIIFTAGATESINLALFGVLHSQPRGRLLTDQAEHQAILGVAAQEKAVVLPVQPTGLIDTQQLRAALTEDIAVISVSYVNNELGTVQSIREIGHIVGSTRLARRAAGSLMPLYLHVDASQAIGHLDLHVARLGIDLLTLSSAKAYGPKQVGVLYVKTGVTLQPLVHGGGQERGLRSGTENVAGIIGGSVALAIAEAERDATAKHLSALRHQAIATLTAALPDTVINGHPRRFSPHILSVSFPGVDGERLLMELDERGVMVATGSACAANHETASHVLTAIGLSPELIRGSLRLSFGRDTTADALVYALAQIIECVNGQRSAYV